MSRKPKVAMPPEVVAARAVVERWVDGPNAEKARVEVLYAKVHDDTVTRAESRELLKLLAAREDRALESMRPIVGRMYDESSRTQRAYLKNLVTLHHETRKPRRKHA